MNSNIFTPTNLAEEKRKFFFDPYYNPQFIYANPIPDTILYKYGAFGGEYTKICKDICDRVISKWGNEETFLSQVEGRILTQEEVVTKIGDYLQLYNIENKISVQFSRNYIPRTSIDGYKMKIRLPIEYREKGIIGVFNHEIGTHILRRLNDERQPWHNKIAVYNLRNHRETEEGLAVLHSYLYKEDKQLWYTALQYYACSLAAHSSFSQVYHELKQYLQNTDRRWNITLRAKRGLADTSKGGGFSRDQIYMRGVMKISRWLTENNFDLAKLYVGKISFEDVDQLKPYTVRENILLPHFYTASTAEYKQNLLEIIKTNKLLQN